MDSNYELLISKINEFTRKFYLNKLLRGLIYTLAILVSLYLILFVLVYYLHPEPLVKTILFFSYLVILSLCSIIGIIKPALAYFRWSKTISLEDAAALIGDHFQQIKDKLLNTLQLKTLADLSSAQNQLIVAGINQKINELKPIPFSKAINFRDNRKYLIYVILPVSIILMLALISPVIIREGSSSFIQYDKKILPAAPFSFMLHQQKSSITQGEDLYLDLELQGDQLPQEVYLKEGENIYKLDKKSNSRFSYSLKNLQKNQTFYFSAGGFDSKTYQVTVEARASLLNIQATIHYPAYLKKSAEVIANAGDLVLPEGSRVDWKFYTESASQLNFFLGNEVRTLSVAENRASLSTVVSNTQEYKVVPKNNFSIHPDSILHKIEVIKDLPPMIQVTEKSDSVSSKALYFSGTITDDHGFSSLRFIYAIKTPNQPTKSISINIPFRPSLLEDHFFYYWNLQSLQVKPGEQIEYYLEVADNDGVNGPKHIRSAVKTFSLPSEQQMAKQLNAESSKLKQKINETIKLAAQVAGDSKKLGQTLLNKKNLSFEDKKDLNQLLAQQKKLEEAVKEIQEAKSKNSNNLAENNAIKDELAEKQKQIDKLFDHVLDPKTKALLEKLQQLMDENNKDQVQQELSKMSVDNKSLRNELDRMLELYKQLEFEQGLEHTIDRLKSLSQLQKELASKTKGKSSNAETLKKEQEKYQEEFNAIKKDMQQLNDKNQALERPNEFRPMDIETGLIQKLQEQGNKELQNKAQTKAAEAQQEAAKKMEQLADELNEDSKQSAEMESNLNAEELRRLLQNLLQTSFDQEKIMMNLKKTAIADPAYVQHVQQQRIVKDNMKTIADSLNSISKRVPQIESSVNTEMQQINFNLDKSIDNLAERKTSEANRNQQYTMTAINNLALMLNEALEQLEKNKKNAKQGGKGSGKQSMQQLQKMQEQLNKSMQQAREQLQKQGNKGSVPKGKMSESFAKMAQQQQMIREALQKLNREDNKDGKGSLGNLNELVKDMKLTESDLMNKVLAEETIRRQQQLQLKLLEADKASREQDEEGKRESKAAKIYPPSYQKMLNEFNKEKNSAQELLQKSPPTLNYYYKNKISDYYKSLNLPQ
jgi:hypothetical protein